MPLPTHERDKQREYAIALTPLLTVTKAKLELSHGALAFAKDNDPSKCMRHALAALEILDGVRSEIENLALECELAERGWTKRAEQIYHRQRTHEFGAIRSFLDLWRKRFRESDGLTHAR